MTIDQPENAGSKPLLLLDIDGVLNPFERADCPAGFDEHDVIGFRVRLSRGHADWLHELTDHFDVVWATTWEVEAQTEIAPRLGLPHWPFIEFGGINDADTWKLADVAAYVGDRPAAWVDDDLGRDAYAWAAASDHRLLIHTDPAVGLTRGQVDQLLEFASAVMKAEPS